MCRLAPSASAYNTAGAIMTVSALVILIGSYCGINPSLHAPTETKITCMEQLTNCAVQIDGVIAPNAGEVCTKIVKQVKE